MRFLAKLGVIALAIFQICSGQEKAPPLRTIRLLAVGDPPSFRQEIRDGVRYEVAPPKGSVPPVKVEVSAVNGEGVEQKSEYELKNAAKPGLRLKLNQISTRLSVPDVELNIRLIEEGRSWHHLRLPEGGDFLVVLWRDPKVKNWSKARSILVKDGGPDFQAGDLRCINVSPADLGFMFGEKDRFEVAGGQTVFKSLGISEGIPTRVMYQGPKGRWQRLWSSALVQNRGERSTVVVYFADGKKPRKPVKLITLRDRALPFPRAK